MAHTPGSAENCHYFIRRLSLYSIRRLERLLGLSRGHMRALAAFAGRYYSPFEKPTKPQPFQRKFGPPKLRIIDNPERELKIAQSLIAKRLLKPLLLPPNIMGGIKGRSVLDNASLHKNSRVLLKIDIKRFFPSITNRHVYCVWRKMLDCSPRSSSLLTKLTTFQRHLPQGAPTSTMLANLVLYSCDGLIREECRVRNIQYSSWVDDLAFSSDDPRPVISVVIKVLREHGFRVSRGKLEIIGPGRRKVLNGVVLGRRFGIPPDRLSRIRAGIHNLGPDQVPETEFECYVQSLKGSIAQISPVCPSKAAHLKRDFEEACAKYPRDFV